MFGGFSMNKEELLKTAAGLSSFWDGKPSTRVRAKGESIILYGKRFSLHLMMQESVFNRVFSNELLKTQGFLARCLVVYPESMIGKRRYQDVNLADDPALKTYFQSLSDLLNKPFLLKNPNVPNELQPKKIEMEKKAKGIWIDFHNELDKRLLSSGDFHSIRRFASKAPEQVLRIAGILTVFYQNDFSFVSEGTIKQAIELVDFYLNEAARIEGLNQTNGYLELAQESLLWLENYQRKTNEQSIPISTLYQKGPLKVRNKNLALKVLFVLQDHGYGQIINNQEYKGKRHRIVWVPRLVDKMSC
ncbi:MAG: hypothetical protein S4CHLAM123_03210 [Chlamydiales bacterium]|nr:hypothetical protein [Chlamydiales bacterium]